MPPQDEVGSWKALATAVETAAGVAPTPGVEESQLGYMLRTASVFEQLAEGADQQPAIADHPTDATVNAILAALRAYGLIASS